ncbi:hypothetical protein [Exiguobacterium sp. TNDT2]|uniref:hypothetical protein n=1 Tax=Exiguobacterium sp. TNDT2 TaxID=2233531 RepID=UPI000DEEB2C5|nr:hypothetical protein [Exiguobacterium sp. TNDT2]
MTKKPIDFDAYNKQLSQHQQRTKQVAETYRQKSENLKLRLESSARSRDEALAQEITELKQATKRNVSRNP